MNSKEKQIKLLRNIIKEWKINYQYNSSKNITLNKPISDLRNYNQVLEKVSVGSPVYLTKNGHGCYTIMDINEQEEMYEKAMKYDKLVAEMELMSMLNESVVSANEEGWIDEDEMLKHFEKRFNND